MTGVGSGILESNALSVAIQADEAPLSSELSIPNIRDYEYPTLLRVLAQRADEGWIPTADDAKAFVCVMAEQAARHWYSPEFEEFEKDHPLPWPGGAQTSNNTISDGFYYLEENNEIFANSKSLGAIKDTVEDWEGISQIISRLCPKMTDDDKAEFGIWVFDHVQTMNDYLQGWEMDKIVMVFRVIGSVDPYSEASVRLGGRFAQFLEEHVGNAGVRDSPEYKGSGTDEQWFLYSSEIAHLQKHLYRYIASGDCSEKRQNFLMGMFLRDNGVTRELNTMREMLYTGKLSKTESDAMEDMLRSTLGLLTDKPIHTNLADLYAAIRFEEYPVSVKMEHEIMTTTAGLLTKYAVSYEDNIVELGSGTGWLTGSLYKEGFQKMRGIDASERNVQVSREKYGDHFRIGDWYKLDDASRSQKAVISLGRSLPHTEEENKFYDVLVQASRVLQEGGVFIFDMPDSTQGNYWENVQRYRSVLGKFGFTEKELTDEWIIVDSPDGEHFYNRFVPPPERITQMLNNLGFAMRETIVQDIPNGHGDKNIVFVAEKLANPVWEASSKR